MKSFHKKRLLKLANFLESVPRKKFDLGVVMVSGNIEQVEAKCPTAACACGYCPTVFPRSVTYKHTDTDFWGNSERKLKFDVTLKDDPNGNYVSMARKMFGLNYEEVEYLFHPFQYPADRQGPKSVAKRIKHFVENNGDVNLVSLYGGVR